MEGVLLILLNFIFILNLNKVKKNLNSNKINKKSRIILLNLIIISELIIYIIASNFAFYLVEKENDDYLGFLANNFFLIISPYFWLCMIYFFNIIFDKIRINKNRKLNLDSQYIYYRDNLSKISPSIISFISTFSIDFNKDIAATILKLKLEGYIEEKNAVLCCTNKNTNNILLSEKIILEAIRCQKFDKEKYFDTVKNEAINMNFLKQDNSKKISKILKTFALIFIPIVVMIVLLLVSFLGSLWLDKYYPIKKFHNISYVQVDKATYDKYQIKPSSPNATKEERLKNINNAMQNLTTRTTDFYGNYYIRLDKLEPLNTIYSTITVLMILIFIFSFVPTISLIINRLKNINNNYTRTIKGIEIANKAYGLKNYLGNYSLMKERNEEQIILFEYYLVYAVSLGINVKIEDEIINKFIVSII